MASRTPRAGLHRRPNAGHDRIIGRGEKIDRERERHYIALSITLDIIRNINLIKITIPT